MSDFEVVPIGTQARLAQVEAERDSLKEILDHIPQVEAELEETSDRLHAVEAERDALRETQRKFGAMMHEAMNERDALRAERDALKQTLHDELDGNLRLRELGGARKDEPFTTFIERVIAEREALLAALKGLVAWADDLRRDDPVEDLRKARAAIAKAEGGGNG